MGVTCERNIEHASLWMLALKMISTTYDHHVYHECSKIVFMRLSLPTYAFSMRTPLWPIAALCCWGRLIYFYIPNMVRLTCVLTWSVCRLPVMVRGTILLLCFLLSWASVISMLARAHPTWIFYLRILWSKGSRVPFLYVPAFELGCVNAKCEAYDLVFNCLSF